MELARNESPLPPLSSAVIGFPVGQTGLESSKLRKYCWANGETTIQLLGRTDVEQEEEWSLASHI